MKLNILIFINLISFCTIGQNLDLKFQDKIDMNSDSKIETISVKQINSDSYKYRLTINESEIDGNLNEEIDGFLVIDINKWDKYKEIAVHTSGPSNDDVYMIYWYDGKNILFMDTLARWPEFIGNGIVYLNNWEGFWSPREKYQLDNLTRKLIHFEQPAYYVGFKTKINKGFNIYLDKDLKIEVATLADSSEIEIILCDKKGKTYFDYLFLIKSATGLVGWADFKSFSNNIDLPMAD